MIPYKKHIFPLYLLKNGTGFYIRKAAFPWRKSAFRIVCRLVPKLAQEAQQHTGSHSRAYHTGHVRPHGMHQQVILGIVFQS